jgi:hypothetical protein
MAQLGPREMSDLSPQSEPKRTLISPLSPIRALHARRAALNNYPLMSCASISKRHPISPSA